MKISASDWAAIAEHFDRLAELAPDDRSQALNALDLDDRQRRQLEHLLAQHDRADALGLDTGAPERLGLDRDAGQENDEPLAHWQGQRLGPWQVDEIIGTGGMSVIYRGHRADGRFDKNVAIKVLNRANLIGDSKRLDEEVRILARLEHPGIARLIDSGTSEAGHSYLVMELVRGRPVDAHCLERSAPPTETVDLAIEAARALEYAHQRQVVHCDIKPANLLVRDNGRLCVVDFGIAALLQRQSDAGGRLYCSPAYTAPERFQRAPPDTSQDVFSLGAVLRELLGERADRDLSAICDKASARDPDERYPAMTALRTELEAWRAKRPVEARNGGRIYKTSRWLQRHAVAATLGVLLLTSLATGVAAALWQASEARSEAARAVAARDFLIGIFEAADPVLSRGEDPPASELLRRGAERVRSAMAGQPRLLSEMLHVIGRTQLERGLIADAAHSLDEVLSLEATRGMPALHIAALSDRGMTAYEQGRFGSSVQFLEAARELALDHDLDGAELDRIEVRLADMLLIDEQVERSLALIETVLARLPDDDPGRIDAMRVYGAALHENGRLDEARRVLENALALQEALDDDDILRAKIENDLGVLHWDLRNLDAAAAAFERSLVHKQAVFGDHHPQTISTLGNLAGVNMARGDPAGAESAWLRSLEALRVVYQGPHPDFAYTRGMLAWSHYMREDFSGALDHVEAAMAHRDALPDSGLSMLAWLTPLRALLQLELNQPVKLGELVQPSQPCTELADLSQLQQRFCLARRLLETDPPAECGPESIPSVPEAVINQLPARWQKAHGILRQRCAGIEPGPVDDALPGWLEDRASPAS